MFLCVRQRAILRMFLYAKVMDKTPYIFSHFEIEKLFKIIKIKIYFYFIPFTSLVNFAYNSLFEHLNQLKKDFYSNDFRRKKFYKSLSKKDYYLSGKLLNLCSLILN